MPSHTQGRLLLFDLTLGRESKTKGLIFLKDLMGEARSFPHISQRFLVYTMGKVGSTSISESLKKYVSEVYDIHFLNEAKLRDNMGKGGHYLDGLFVLHNWLGKPLKIISLVRNPINVNIGGFFQNLEWYYPGLTQEEMQGLSVDELLAKFFSLEPHYPLTWFDNEFNKALGFDVYSQPFSVLGWKTYLHGKYQILIMQLELPNKDKEKIIRAFSGISGFKLDNYNVSADKWYGGKYQEFKQKLKLSREYLDLCLQSKFYQHFYSIS